MLERRIAIGACATVCFLGACGPGGAANQPSTTSTSTSEDTETTESQTEDETDGCDAEFPNDGDVNYWPACNMILQDCPEGEKCVPYASSGTTWNHYKCVLITGDGAPGESCSSTGLLAAQDDCDGTSFCAGFDANNQVGICHPFCSGDFMTPECIEGWGCAVPNEDPFLCEIPVYCVQLCNPLASDCEAGSVCGWTGSTFTCVAASGGAQAGEPCAALDDCGDGLQCMASEFLSDCADVSCCTPYCSLMAGDDACQLIDPNYVCVPFFMQPPPGYEDLGVCGLAP